MTFDEAMALKVFFKKQGYQSTGFEIVHKIGKRQTFDVILAGLFYLTIRGTVSRCF